MPFFPALGAFLTNLGTIAISSIAGGLGALGIGGASAWALSSALVQFGVSSLLNAAIGAVFGKQPKAEDIGRELSQQSTAPAYRFVYGETRATGTPAGIPVKGNFIYGAWIINSRTSDLQTFTLYMDKREVVLTGDAFDMNGAGATATESPFADHLNVWISKGFNTAPPKTFTDEAPWIDGTADHLWKTTDAWKGRTVIWMKIHAGAPDNRQQRWPASPPLVEVEGKWSKVYDPRDEAQSPTDPSSWVWSENHALCVRDALRRNPIRNYKEPQIHASFIDGADVCDETVALKSGGSEKRYTCAGTLVFSEGEIEDQINPMVISGAANLIRIGGQLGYAAGEYRAPTMTLDYLLGDGFEFPDMVPGDQLVNEIRATYLSPARGYETAELLPWAIPGALTEDGGVATVMTLDMPFCASATQAMRVRNITGLKQRRQERIDGGTLPPEAFDLVGGSTVTMSLPDPYDALDGVYEIESIHPGLDPLGEAEGVALRMPAALVKHSASIYAWTAATDEEDVFDQPYDGSREGVALPGVIAVTSGPGVDLNNGAVIVPRFKFRWFPADGDTILSYEWEWRLDGDEWQSGGSVDAKVRDGLGRVFFYLPVAEIATGHDVRVRTIGEKGRSDWRELTGAIYLFNITGAAASAGIGSATFTGTAPSSEAFLGLRVYYGPVGSAFEDATRDVNGITQVDPGAAFSIFAGDNTRTNLITNGNFSSAAAWTLNGGWSIGGGKATHATGTQDHMTQPLAPADGANVRLSYRVADRTDGTAWMRITGGSSHVQISTDLNGVMSATVTAPDGSHTVSMIGQGVFDGSVDDVFAVIQTPICLPLGASDYWIVPVTLTRTEGIPVGPFTLQIP